MKFKKIYTFPVAIGAILFFLSNSSGPGTQFSRQVTGAPGSLLQNSGQPGTCGNAGCHAAGAFDPSITIELLDGDAAVETYEPGKSYTLRIVNTPGSGNPARFGFQAVTLDATDAQAGQWGDLGTGQQKVALSGRDYVEHSSPSMQGTFEMEWIAPGTGTGEVTVYAASNAVNNNGGSSGDGTAAGTLVLPEASGSSTFDIENQLASITVMPNPVEEMLTVEVDSRTGGNFNLRIVDLTGAIVQSEKINLAAGANREQFAVGHLPAGLYLLQLCGDQHVAAAQMMKK